jgi:hypothetical protein
MSNRACPFCFAKVSRSQVLARSNDIVCPACHAGLQLSLPSRLLGSFAGLATAVPAFHLAQSQNSLANWTLSALAAIFAFVAASALVLFCFSDLVLRPQN